MAEENETAVEEVKAEKPITMQDMLKAQKQIDANIEAEKQEQRQETLRKEIEAATAKKAPAPAAGK